jgi:hypothetical protein
MRYRRMALLVAVYMTLDLTNPFVGSAFNFNVEESMDGVPRQHERLLPQTVAVALPARARDDGAPVRSTLAPRSGSRALDGWLVHLRQAHVPRSDSPPPTEDH